MSASHVHHAVLDAAALKIPEGMPRCAVAVLLAIPRAQGQFETRTPTGSFISFKPKMPAPNRSL